jgi:uncharacterized protein (DUF1697 family)
VTVWVALLRAINVGGRVVPMAELRAAVEAAGGEEPRTYIQSGNVVFRHTGRTREALAAQLERAVDERCGVATTVVLRTAAELADVLAAHPFGADTSRTHVGFLAAAPAEPVDLERDGERAVSDGAHVYLSYPAGLGRAKLTAAALERRLGPMTVRNWRTVTRLGDLASGGG